MLPSWELQFPARCFETQSLFHFFPSELLLQPHEVSQAPSLPVSAQHRSLGHLHSPLFWQHQPSPRISSLTHLHLMAAASRSCVAVPGSLVSGLISSCTSLAASFFPWTFSPHLLFTPCGFAALHPSSLIPAAFPFLHEEELQMSETSWLKKHLFFLFLLPVPPPVADWI